MTMMPSLEMDSLASLQTGEPHRIQAVAILSRTAALWLIFVVRNTPLSPGFVSKVAVASSHFLLNGGFSFLDLLAF